jgi:hypothetical protein
LFFFYSGSNVEPYRPQRAPVNSLRLYESCVYLGKAPPCSRFALDG